MKLSVAGRMIALAGTALAGIVLLTALAQRQVEQVYEAANFSTENTVPSLIALDKLRDSFLRMRIRVAQHILNTDEKKLAEIDTSIVEMRNNVDDALKQYAALLADA